MRFITTKMGTRRILFVADLISVIGFREKHFENVFFFDFLYLEPILVILGEKTLGTPVFKWRSAFCWNDCKRKKKKKNEETLEFVSPGSDAASERTLSSFFETSNLERKVNRGRRKREERGEEAWPAVTNSLHHHRVPSSSKRSSSVAIVSLYFSLGTDSFLAFIAATNHAGFTAIASPRSNKVERTWRCGGSFLPLLFKLLIFENW